MEDEEVAEVSLKILDGRKAKVEDISKIVHKGKKILSFKSVYRKRPRLIRKIYFYWIALTNNNKHKMDYIRLKSKIHRLITILDTYTSYVERNRFEEPYNLIDTEEEPIDLTMIIDLFIRMERFIKDYSYLIWYYKIPFKLYIKKYLEYRDDILNIKPSKYIKDKDRVKRRSFKKLLKKTNHIIGEFDIMMDFMKDNVDRLDDLSFKLTITIINIFIFIGQFLWNKYDSIYDFFMNFI